MLPTCFLLQSRFVPQLPRLTRASVQSKAGMIFATAEYTPPEYTPPGWTREQFMEYFAGVVESNFQRWGQTHNRYLAYLPDGFDDLNPVSRIEIMSAIRVAAAHDEEVAMKEMMTLMDLTSGPEPK